MSEIEKRLEELSVVLPKPPAPVANYVPFVRSGTCCSSPGSFRSARTASSPSVTRASSRPNSAARTRARGGAPLRHQRARPGARGARRSRPRAQVVRLGGFFNVASSFDALPQAMNGASDLIAELFGAEGRHARNTVGVSHIPMNALAEVEALFEIKA